MQPFPFQQEAVRPRRQIQLPAYLQDYDLSTSQRHALQPLVPHTAQQQAQGTEERLQHMWEEVAPGETQYSTRAGSPVSQSGIDPMAALTASFEEGLRHASKQNME